MLHQIKAPQFYNDLGLQKTELNPLANGKIQGLFKAFECFSGTFQGNFYFQRTFQDSPVYSCTFQACANPNFPISIGRMSLSKNLAVLGGIFHFYSHSNRTFCEQTVETLIRSCVLRRLIWVCAVCLCPT